MKVKHQKKLSDALTFMSVQDHNKSDICAKVREVLHTHNAKSTTTEEI